MYNRLVSYQADQKGKKENYSYDAEGVRRSKTASEGEEEKEILFISDTSGELSRTLAETDEEGELLASYGWGDTLLSQTREGKTSTYLYDGQGNVRGLLDEKGNLTDTYAYNAYGELTEKTGETENYFQPTGEYSDGVYYDSSVCIPLFKGKIDNTYLCYIPFIRKGCVFFLRDCRWCSSLHPLSRLSACPTHLPN